MKALYVEGDLFTLAPKAGGTVAIPHVCNDVGAWGAGFVVPLANKYPQSRASYLAWFKGDAPESCVYLGGPQFALGNTQMIAVASDPDVLVCNMIAQHRTGGVRPLRYNALAACMESVGRELKNHYPEPSIHAPLFGAGLAGGNWDFIEKLIEDCWLSRDVPVTIYYLRDKLPPGWSPPSEAAS